MSALRRLAPLGAGLLLLTTACTSGGDGPGDGGGSAPPATDAEAAERAESVLGEMSLDDQVGQLFVLNAAGTTPDENARAIADHRPGGLIYFPENLGSPAEIAELSNGLQETAAAEGAGVPLMIGVDQEQGMVARLEEGTRFPDAMAVGATRDTGQAEALASATAAELAAVGINLDYAPVADVNTNADNPVIGIRSFGADPGLVGQMASAEAGAFADGGVVPVVKHFPGHGDTGTDSHTGLPVIEKDRADWERDDLPPVADAVEAGADAIMTAHVVMPALDDSGEPATLSPKVIDGVLRDELGYDGVVTTDALNMEGVRQTHDDGEVAVRAVEAGADQLLMPPDPQAAFSAVRSAVDEGRISEDRLDESVRRILELKAKRGILDAGPVDAGKAAEVFSSDDTAQAAQDLADASVTMLRNEGGVLPVDEGAQVAVQGAGAEEISAALEDLGVRTTGSASGADLVVVGTNGARGDAEQRRAVEKAASGGAPVAVVAQGTPYDLQALPDVDAYLAVYSSVPVSRTAAARAIAGEVDPKGKLPVPIPETGMEYGDGLSY
ncbi:glycoside hydrolase family 3 C-terminal domain-containing protein [Nocardiopsis sp. RSe5-2]|uniref:beta-N-acetylhexosaminidase n=1 Tax=Nocardiopsis endophytica TaxID=3018445 RepID=A0ABT4U181_9ACTN|nr:glycoside hydrolase family 3 protein [Nocardiopsis endophytica]MDA2810259.1 glycoside hydrolase family 3 C-terminal domain-containing protein [Nocardiopsis endophytica]